jgi:hypothetical protein
VCICFALGLLLGQPFGFAHALEHDVGSAPPGVCLCCPVVDPTAAAPELLWYPATPPSVAVAPTVRARVHYASVTTSTHLPRGPPATA